MVNLRLPNERPSRLRREGPQFIDAEERLARDVSFREELADLDGSVFFAVRAVN